MIKGERILASEFDDWLLDGKKLYSYYKVDNFLLIDKYSKGHSIAFHPANSKDLKDFIKAVFKSNYIRRRI